MSQPASPEGPLKPRRRSPARTAAPSSRTTPARRGWRAPTAAHKQAVRQRVLPLLAQAGACPAPSGRSPSRRGCGSPRGASAPRSRRSSATTAARPSTSAQGERTTACAFCGSKQVLAQETTRRAIRPGEPASRSRSPRTTRTSASAPGSATLWFRPNDLKKMAKRPGDGRRLHPVLDVRRARPLAVDAPSAAGTTTRPRPTPRPSRTDGANPDAPGAADALGVGVRLARRTASTTSWSARARACRRTSSTSSRRFDTQAAHPLPARSSSPAGAPSRTPWT